jgi:thiosulfate dehydrogenase
VQSKIRNEKNLCMENKFRIVNKFKLKTVAVFVVFVAIGIAACNNNPVTTTTKTSADTTKYSLKDSLFIPPDTSTIPHDQFGEMVRYGRELIVNTAYYIGPNGTKGHYLGNKMNCANCHVDAGTRPFAFNYFSSHARYPQYRGRENRVLTLGERINNCVERPHNGTPLPLDSKEIVAMVCYMKWLSANVPVGQHVKGDEALELDYPKRAADVKKGREIFAANCASCHGANGAGQLTADSSTYTYPPLWGVKAYQEGSSPSRVLKLARFIKANMPDKKATWNKPFLTDEQSIDVAAFINDEDIHPRPHKKDKDHPDFPNVKAKPIDYEMGPYQDTFTAYQHKYGPYQPIIDYHKAHNLPVIF